MYYSFQLDFSSPPAPLNIQPCNYFFKFNFKEQVKKAIKKKNRTKYIQKEKNSITYEAIYHINM